MVANGRCENCELEVFLSNDEEGKTRIEKVECERDGEQFEIMYFICPSCVSIETLQIDTAETNKLLNRSIELLKKGQKTKDQKKRQKLKVSFQHTSKKLNDLRLKLSVLADGKTFATKDGNRVIYHAPGSRMVTKDES